MEEEKNKKREGIVAAVTPIKEFNGKLNFGFKLIGISQWFNVYGEKSTLEELLKLVVKDNKINFIVDLDGVKDIKLIEKAPEKNPDIIKIGNKDYMLYSGLLKKAHEKKERFSMEITDSWVSEDMKRAWCKVRLRAYNEGKGEQIFDGFGSSTPDNATTIGSQHPVEMAHTRAKGRALRDYLNIGEVMAEELSQN